MTGQLFPELAAYQGLARFLCFATLFSACLVMDRSPLHPLRLLPALLATPDQERRHLENEINQWLGEKSEEDKSAVVTSVDAAATASENIESRVDQTVDGATKVPDMGETIPGKGQ
jgi:hypothetical protein